MDKNQITALKKVLLRVRKYWPALICSLVLATVHVVMTLYVPVLVGLAVAAAISIPGTTLSQLGMNTSASKQCAFTIHSMLSAISSREARL